MTDKSDETGFQLHEGRAQLLRFANVGFHRIVTCHDGEPGVGVFWPACADPIIKRRVTTVAGPKVSLDKSTTDK